MSAYTAPIPPVGPAEQTSPQDRVRQAPRPTAAPATPVTGRRTSVLAAGLLALFFGPVGLLYSSVLGAAITSATLLVIGLPIALFYPPWMFAAAVLVTPLCVIWAVLAALAHNVGRHARVWSVRSM